MRRVVTATGYPPAALRGLGVSINQARKHTLGTRAEAAQSGVAMRDGSYAIFNRGDLADAYKDWLRTGKPPAVKVHLEKRAKALNAPSPFFDD